MCVLCKALKCRGLAEWETLLEPEECECVTLLGQIISEIDTGSEKKPKPSGGNEKGKSCVCGDWVSSFMLNEVQSPTNCPARWDAAMVLPTGRGAPGRAWGNSASHGSAPCTVLQSKCCGEIK